MGFYDNYESLSFPREPVLYAQGFLHAAIGGKALRVLKKVFFAIEKVGILCFRLSAQCGGIFSLFIYAQDTGGRESEESRERQYPQSAQQESRRVPPVS